MLSMIICIVFIYLLYFFWISFNYDKTGNLKKHRKGKNNNPEEKIPPEFQLFIYRYNIDLSKVNLRYLLQFLALVVAIDLSIVVTVISFINILWLKLVLGFILMLVFVFISFKIAGDYFNKKGLVKNDKRNNKRKDARK